MSVTVYSISHAMQPWLQPPGINCLLLLCGLITWFFCRRLSFVILLIGFLSLYLLSTPYVAYHLINRLQDQYLILQPSDLAMAKKNYAIMILGGGDVVQAEYGHKRASSIPTQQRANYGAYLYQQTKLPIIASGGHTTMGSNSEAELMTQYLADHFNIKVNLLEDQSLTTADESKFVLPILANKHLDGVYLVTHAWHMPRSVYIFRCQGINVIPAPMGHYVYGPGYSLISFFPNMEAFYASGIALHEWIGLLWYRLYYGNACKTRA